MAYFLDSNLPEHDYLVYSLTKVYGIGKSRAIKICRTLGFQKFVKFSDLDRGQRSLLKRVIEANYDVGFVLRQSIKSNIKLHIKCKSYRGSRHRSGYPVRGQRTKTNASNCKKIKIK